MSKYNKSFIGCATVAIILLVSGFDCAQAQLPTVGSWVGQQGDALGVMQGDMLNQGGMLEFQWISFFYEFETSETDAAASGLHHGFLDNGSGEEYPMYFVEGTWRQQSDSIHYKGKIFSIAFPGGTLEQVGNLKGDLLPAVPGANFGPLIGDWRIPSLVDHR